MNETSVRNLLEDERLLPGELLAILTRVAEVAADLGLPLYVVGGFVRDLLLRHAVSDFDLVVEGDAPRLANVLVSKFGGKVVVHAKFRTAKWILRDSEFGKHLLDASPDSQTALPEFLDLISARSESYKHPAALPTVKPGELKDDLLRRDFTINAMAIRLDGDHFGELHDDPNGQIDLEAGVVRVLHPRSFLDDPTRMYRAVRYEQRYGFKIVDETLALIPEARALVDKLSAQRIRHELDLILGEAKADLMLARLADLDLLKPIHASLPWDESVRMRFQVERHPELLQKPTDGPMLNWILWLLTLPETKIESLNKRLHFTSTLSRALLSASSLFTGTSSLTGLKPSECVGRLQDVPSLAVYAVYLAVQDGKPKQALETYLSKWRHIKPRTTGKDLQKMGVLPGPRYRQILSRLRAAWLDGEVRSDAEEQSLLEKIVHNG